MRKVECLFLSTVILFLTFSIGVMAQEDHKHPEGITADNAIELLKAGNERFVSGEFMQKDYAERVAATQTSQHPYAIVLTCADSRVSPEILFDETIGKLFVIRVAGNVVDPETLGSIEYAAKYLKTPLFVVLGHTSCGAVGATVKGGDYSDNIMSLATRIAPAVERAKAHSHDDLVEASVRENVSYQIEQSLAASQTLKKLHDEGHLKIVGGIYSIEDGRVEFMED